MSCPNCGNMVLYALGDDPAGTIRCGKCGNVFPEAESKDLEFKNQILEELKKISERLTALEKKSLDVNNEAEKFDRNSPLFQALSAWRWKK